MKIKKKSEKKNRYDKDMLAISKEKMLGRTYVINDNSRHNTDSIRFLAA
jgi:hypothetical protein